MSKGGVVEMKDDQLPILYLARHRETAWLSAQHPGLTDLPLTERGEQTARRIGQRLYGIACDALEITRRQLIPIFQFDARIAHRAW